MPLTKGFQLKKFKILVLDQTYGTGPSGPSSKARNKLFKINFDLERTILIPRPYFVLSNLSSTSVPIFGSIAAAKGNLQAKSADFWTKISFLAQFPPS